MSDECIYIPGENTYFEEIQTEKGRTMIIYLTVICNELVQKPKCFAEYMLEQVLDEDNNVISETIKKNPHCIE